MSTPFVFMQMDCEFETVSTPHGGGQSFLETATAPLSTAKINGNDGHSQREEQGSSKETSLKATAGCKHVCMSSF